MPRIISIDDLNTDAGSGYSAVFEYSYSQPPLSVQAVEREGQSPVVTAVSPGLNRPPTFTVMIEGDDYDNLRNALLRVLDTSAGARAITICDDDGGRERYMMVYVEKADQTPGSGGLEFAVSTISTDDVRWRAADAAEATWHVTTSGATHTVTNGGEVDAYPIWTITPRDPKSASNWVYARRVLARARYRKLGTPGPTPLEITGGGWNTAALVTAGKVSDNTNIAVMVDGRYVPHWYGGNDGAARGFNSNNTTIWINYGLSRNTVLIYQATDDEETNLVVLHQNQIDEWTTIPMPMSGRLYFAATGEIITYDGVHSRGNGLYDLLNVKRGVDGTTAAALAYTAEGEIVPRILILYGPDGAVPAAEQTAEYRNPPFGKPLVANGASTNSLWSWTYFKSGTRTAAWSYLGELYNAQFTQATGVNGATGDFVEPWTAMGWKADRSSLGYFYIHLPLPVAELAVNGRHMASGDPIEYPGAPALMLRYGSYEANTIKLWGAEQGQPYEFTNGPFSLTITTSALADATGLRWEVSQATYVQADIQSLQVVFNSSATPLVTLGAEVSDYDMELTLENETTSEALTITLPNMEMDESVVIDSGRQTVVYTGDNTNRYTAVRRDAPRRRFLKLAPGNNTIRVTETGLADVEVTATFRERYYT